VDPVPDPLLFFSGSAGNRTRASGPRTLTTRPQRRSPPLLLLLLLLLIIIIIIIMVVLLIVAVKATNVSKAVAGDYS
jgi:hypothetical protein